MLVGLVALIVAEAPLRLVHFVGEVPVGVIELELRPSKAIYRATHVFRDDQRRFETSWQLDARHRDADGLASELQLLASRPAPGCVVVREERTGRRETLCLDDSGAGRIDDTAIRASWNHAGALTRLDVLDASGQVVSRFERSQAAPIACADPFAKGFPVEGEGSLPSVTGATRVSVSAVAKPMAGNCLAAARAFVKTGDVVEVGLVVEQRRAWPHAWVRQRDGTRVDPTVSSTTGREYLAFETERAGQLYLELAAGSRRVLSGPR